MPVLPQPGLQFRRRPHSTQSYDGQYRIGRKRYYCAHCHKTDCKQYIIPVIVAAAVVGSGRRGGGFGDGFGGGFGGGATGGGGSTSGW